MKKAKKKEVFRPYDLIRIVNPEFFVRVGYPFDKEYAIENLISKEEKSTLRQLLGYAAIYSVKERRVEKTYSEMLDRLAYHKLQLAGFGGSSRKIFTKRKEEFLGKEVQVLTKRVVQTGIREYYSDYDPEEDRGGGYYGLANQESHVLLEINTYDRDEIISGPYLWIEEKNVEKIK
jgi:hypothetical protein